MAVGQFLEIEAYQKCEMETGQLFKVHTGQLL